MTRGYVVITCGKKVKKYGYLSSDAYVSWYGKEILQAIIDGDIDRYVDNIIKDNHACYGDEESNPEFTLSWIRRDQSNKDWGNMTFMSMVICTTRTMVFCRFITWAS